MSLELDKYALLDPAKMRRDIEAAVGHTVFTVAADTDHALMIAQIEAATGHEITNAALLDDARLIIEVDVLFEGTSSTSLLPSLFANTDTINSATVIPPVAPAITFDSTSAKFDSTLHTMDEAA